MGPGPGSAGTGTGGAALARRVRAMQAENSVKVRNGRRPRKRFATGGRLTFINLSLKPTISLSAVESTVPASRSAASFSSVYGATNLESILAWQSAIVLARDSEVSAGAHIVRRPATRRASDTPRLASIFCGGVGALGVREQKRALGRDNKLTRAGLGRLRAPMPRGEGEGAPAFGAVLASGGACAGCALRAETSSALRAAQDAPA